VLTQDGQIVQVAPAISSAASETAIREIDALGLTLLPGVIDPQVHFEPGLEHKETCSQPAVPARGGVTSFLEMPNTRPLTTTQLALDDKLQRASRSAWSVAFIGATADICLICSTLTQRRESRFLGIDAWSVVG